MIKTVFEFTEGVVRVSSHGFGSIRCIGRIGSAVLNFVVHSDELWAAVFEVDEGDPRSGERWQHAKSVIYGLAMLQLEELRKEGVA